MGFRVWGFRVCVLGFGGLGFRVRVLGFGSSGDTGQGRIWVPALGKPTQQVRYYEALRFTFKGP